MQAQRLFSRPRPLCLHDVQRGWSRRPEFEKNVRKGGWYLPGRLNLDPSIFYCVSGFVWSGLWDKFNLCRNAYWGLQIRWNTLLIYEIILLCMMMADTYLRRVRNYRGKFVRIKIVLYFKPLPIVMWHASTSVNGSFSKWYLLWKSMILQCTSALSTMPTCCFHV